MKKFLLIIATVVYSITSFAQILITDPDLDQANPLDCIVNSGPTANFFDSGGNGANYTGGENETIVVCPDFGGGTSKLSITFGINTGLLFDVDGSDTIYVYDGLNTSAPLLGKHNSDTDPFGFNHSASFINNPSGCLTVQFVSDNLTEGTGWDANITCAQNPQPFTPRMEAYLNGTGPDIINPVDTGYADVCLGDSIMYVATGTFPFSSDVTGVGYSQNNTNVTYTWSFSDGSQAVGDTVWFVPNTRSGFIVLLQMTDLFPQTQSVTSKVRVATIPSFAGVINNRDSICVGDTTLIIGAVTAFDTAGVNATNSNFQLGGIVAGLTPLPDGSGINYTTSVNISGFNIGDTISSVSDIQELNVTMEHSFLGDLEMLLECPNGTQVNIFNGNTGGIIPGGFGGSGTYLGDALDNSLGVPGIGWDYTWSSSNPAAWGDFPTRFALGAAALVPTTLVAGGMAMDPNGVYNPEESFANFIGCPLNGNWTIIVRDNLGIDDGFIFEWGILFDPVINPNNEVYAPEIVSGQWLTAATILPGSPTDTAISVTSDTPGDFDYIFQVTDSYGCTHDTSVTVHFFFPPFVPANDTVCDTVYQVVGATSPAGGTWSWTTTGSGTATFSSVSDQNPLITVDEPGRYEFTFSDVLCGRDTSFFIDFAPTPVTVPSIIDICGDEFQVTGTTSLDGGSWLFLPPQGPGNVTFSPGPTVENPLISVDVLGTYTFTYFDNQCFIPTSFQVTFFPTPVIPNSTVVCEDEYQVIGSTSSGGGVWTSSGPGTPIFSPSNTDQNPLITVENRGIYTFTFTDDNCGIDSSFQIVFPAIIPPFTVNGADFCAGESVELNAGVPFPGVTYSWNGVVSDSTLIVFNPGQYTATVAGPCNSESATAIVIVNACNISAPNIITPNGDGMNDVLFFIGLDQFPGSSLSVRNRWGKEVYQNGNYQNDWSPTDLADGTYFYILTPGGNADAEVITNSITILH